MPTNRRRTGTRGGLSFRRSSLLAAHPIRDRLPVGIVLRPELPPAVMELITAGVFCERMLQQPAAQRIAGLHQPRNGGEVLLRLLLGPARGPFRQRLKAEQAVAGGMAGNAARVSFALFHENRLDA